METMADIENEGSALRAQTAAKKAGVGWRWRGALNWKWRYIRSANERGLCEGHREPPYFHPPLGRQHTVAAIRSSIDRPDASDLPAGAPDTACRPHFVAVNKAIQVCFDHVGQFERKEASV